MLLRLAPVLAPTVAALAAGCGGGTTPATTSSLPPGCDVGSIEPVVTGFLGAVSSGDAAALRRRVSAAPNYLVHDGSGRRERRVHMTTRRAVLAYYARRARLGEKSRLITLRVAPGIDANHVLVEFRLTRVAHDFPRRGITTRLATATGRVNCVHGTIERLLVQGPSA